MKTKLPTMTFCARRQAVSEKDRQQKQSMIWYADVHRGAKMQHLNIGDTVLMQQMGRGKLATRYDSHPYNVVRLRGSQVTASRQVRSVTSNYSFFKKIKSDLVSTRELAANRVDSDDGGSLVPEQAVPQPLASCASSASISGS